MAFTGAFLGATRISQATPAQSAFFDGINFTDVTVTPVGNTYTVTLGPDPSFMIGSTTYDIASIFGFYVIKNNDPDTLGATGSDFTSSTGTWTFGTNTGGAGSVAGWDTTGNVGILPSGSQSFTFTTLDSGSVDTVGFHVKLDDGELLPNGSNTGFVKESAVPEPASLGALAIGALALIRRRRR